MLLNLIISTLATLLTALIVAIICMPIAFVSSLGIKREYSLDFWIRSIVLSQILFWGALILDASATSFGYFQSASDLIPVIFNFLISIPATALMIRTCMRFRKSKTPVLSEAENPKDRLDKVFDTLKNSKNAAEKAENILSK